MLNTTASKFYRRFGVCRGKSKRFYEVPTIYVLKISPNPGFTAVKTTIYLPRCVNVMISADYVYKHLILIIYKSLVVRKPVFGVSDLVQYKPGCVVTEDG